MGTRLCLLLSAVFFAAMNVWLWRAEVRGRNPLASPVPVATVWQKVVASPDQSSLEIRRQGARIGSCRWLPSVTESREAPQPGDENRPEGMVRQVLGYTIDLSGHVVLDETTRLRFNCELKFDPRQNWQELHARVQCRPNQWELRVSTAEQSIHFLASDGETRFERRFRFADLEHPEAILREVGGPLFPAMLAAFGVPLNLVGGGPTALRITGTARQEIGRASCRERV